MNFGKPCSRCPYKLGIIKTLVNPCPQCKASGYKYFEELQDGNSDTDDTETQNDNEKS